MQHDRRCAGLADRPHLTESERQLLIAAVRRGGRCHRPVAAAVVGHVKLGGAARPVAVGLDAGTPPSITPTPPPSAPDRAGTRGHPRSQATDQRSRRPVPRPAGQGSPSPSPPLARVPSASTTITRSLWALSIATPVNSDSGSEADGGVAARAFAADAPRSRSAPCRSARRGLPPAPSSGGCRGGRGSCRPLTRKPNSAAPMSAPRNAPTIPPH
jgi:hypothetical protein